MEYKFPDEPVMGSKVEDRDGRVWQRNGADRWRSSRLYTDTTWKYLVVNYGPLKDYVEPQNGDVRKTPNKDSTIYFDIYIDGAWHSYIKSLGKDIKKYQQEVDW